jgi:hypothetical protein
MIFQLIPEKTLDAWHVEELVLYGSGLLKLPTPKFDVVAIPDSDQRGRKA